MAVLIRDPCVLGAIGRASGVARYSPVRIGCSQFRQAFFEFSASIIDHKHILMAQDDDATLRLVQDAVQPIVGIGFVSTDIVDGQILAVLSEAVRDE